MADFKVANAEFDRQAVILEALVATIEVSARQDDHVRCEIAGSVLPVIPAGGQNTMAAAAIVLLAAHFEEYVRQQIEAYAEGVVCEYAHLPDEFRERLIDTYWRAGSGRLSRIRPKADPLWISSAEPVLRSLIGYPIGANITDFVATYICEHENNMRWDTLIELTSRIGIKNLSDLMFRSTALRQRIGILKKSDFSRGLQQRLNEFYVLRNGIVHQIAQNSGIGATVFHDWAAFFRLLTTVFAEALQHSFEQFCVDVSRRKAAAGAA